MTNPTPKFLIEDIETLKIIADPQRIKILKTLKKPKTVKEIGAVLSTPPSKLYYHVNLMEKHGLIQVVATNIVSGIIEKQYQVAALNYQIAENLIPVLEADSSELVTIVDSIFETTRDDLYRSLQSGLMDIGDKSFRSGLIWHGRLHLPPEKIDAFCQSLQDLLQESEASNEVKGSDAGQAFGLTIAFYPQAADTEE